MNIHVITMEVLQGNQLNAEGNNNQIVTKQDPQSKQPEGRYKGL